MRERVKIFEKGGIITKKILGPVGGATRFARNGTIIVWRKYFNRLLVFDWTGISGRVDSSELIISIEEASRRVCSWSRDRLLWESGRQAPESGSLNGSEGIIPVKGQSEVALNCNYKDSSRANTTRE